MFFITEYELRQLIQIKKKISLFEEENLNLFELVSDLEGLLGSLESISESWEDDFLTEVNTLEMIHDSIEDGSISRWNGNYKVDMHNSISKLKTMTQSVLDDYLGHPDSKISEKALEADSNWLICSRCNNAWNSSSLNAMVICPACIRALHNPRIANMQE